MDRNISNTVENNRGVTVALRKESVDRNSADRATNDEVMVALRKESVDRNTLK